MADLFPSGSPIRRIIGDGTLLLGGGRALLMQVAHPSVADGVARHSGFGSDPFGRLLRTLEASYGIVFGTEQEAHRIAAGVNAVHKRVTGPGYAATDPDLLMWVHATLIDTALVVRERYLGALDPAVAEVFYEQSTVVAELFGCPRHRQPADLTEFRTYVRHMVDTLEVSDTGRQLARSVLHARLPFPVPMAMPMVRAISTGLLPRRLRQELGLPWDARRTRALAVSQAAARRVLPLVPPPVRRAPVTLLARTG